MADPGFTRHNQIGGDTDKQAVPDETSARLQRPGQACEVGDRAKLSVKNDVALVGAVQGAVIRTRRGGGTEAFQASRLRAPTEFENLHRQNPMRAELGRQLARIHDDDFAAARLGYDLLTQQCAAPALDQVQRRVNLVSAGPLKTP